MTSISGTQHLRRHTLLWLCAATALASCGGADKPAEQTSQPGTSTTAPSAAPAPSPGTSTPQPAQGAVLTDDGLSIHGTNRWTGNPQLFWDDVQTGFDAAGATLGAEVGIGPQSPWGTRSSTSALRFRYESGTTRSGETGLIYRAHGHHTVLGSPRYTGTATTFDRLYVSWWYKPSIHPNSQAASNKFIRLWDEGNGYGTRISWTQMHMTCDVPAGYTPTVSWRGWGGNTAQWNRHEIDARLDQPMVRTSVNGAAGHAHPCVKNPNQPRPLYVYWLGFDHGGNADGTNSYQDMVTEVADIYIANSPARVELSDSPTWSGAQRKELLPVRQWAPDRIDLRFTRGIFPRGTALYAYVVNADGSVAEAGMPVSCQSQRWC